MSIQELNLPGEITLNDRLKSVNGDFASTI